MHKAPLSLLTPLYNHFLHINFIFQNYVCKVKQAIGELEWQRRQNFAAGLGKVTDAEADAQRAANAKGEHGAITDAEVEAAEALATLMGMLKDGKLKEAAALVNNKDAKWSKAYEADLEKMLLKGDVGKVKMAQPQHQQRVRT